MNDLKAFGWTDTHQSEWNSLNLATAHPARVVADFGTSIKLATPTIITAELSGKLAHYTERDATPKVGDWVSVAITDSGSATVESVVLRSNEIARKVAGKRALKQVVAANVDIAFVLVALDEDFSVERLQRYLYQLSVHKVEPVIVLNKADKTDDLPSYLTQLATLDAPIVITNAKEGLGVEEIAKRINPGKTAILLGSSGVGKSTLTNKLLGREVQLTNEVRESDSTGKHTTVHRELFILPNGGILIDTPGIRELQLWGTEDDLETNFDDVAALAVQCKYSNCRHGSEEGCVIQQSLKDGSLNAKHYENYLKMKSELVKLAEKNVERIKAEKSRQKFTTKNKQVKKNTRYHADDF